ncbi:MAG: hypothetical protein M3024_03955 [Candidatus Dormibacteraeota bacterium]|nr:hypothetical protein [Candidatus Dormibacteraeota bacterium]
MAEKEKQEPKKPPPWDWRAFGADQIEAEMEELAEWVDRLQQRYRMVKLPPCWPCHDGLRFELIFFWYWEEQIVEAAVSAEEGVRWHDQLRRAAPAWAETYLGCDHQGRKLDEEAQPLTTLAQERAAHSRNALERQLRLGVSWP